MADLTPQAFAEKWANSKLSERSAYQQHFLDLCRMLGQPIPSDADPEGIKQKKLYLVCAHDLERALEAKWGTKA